MHARRLLAVLFALGLYLTLRGYHSRDGDQAYRLPLLLHRQDPAVFANDPFVRAFDDFNPHQGSLALLDGLSRVTGLSAALFLLFFATFVVTAYGIDRLARAIWPDSGPRVGFIAVALVLMAKAGNLGTNHLFEAMLLDRLMAFALGWLAIGGLVADPARARILGALCIVSAAFIHPSLGLQIGGLCLVGWLVFPCLPRWSGVTWRTAIGGAIVMLLAIMPSLWFTASQGTRLFDGMPPDDYLTLAASVQSPQHMLPHLWRMPQWLAAGGYLVVAIISLFDRRRTIEDGQVDSSVIDNDNPLPLRERVAAMPPGEGSAHGPRARSRTVPGSQAQTSRRVPDPSPGGIAATLSLKGRGLSALSQGSCSRLLILLGLTLVGLGCATIAIEGFGSIRITLFQPFRMATVARGLCLVLMAEHVRSLWDRGHRLSRMRCAALVAGLAGDWAFVAAVLFDASAFLAERMATKLSAVFSFRSKSISRSHALRGNGVFDALRRLQGRSEPSGARSVRLASHPVGPQSGQDGIPTRSMGTSWGQMPGSEETLLSALVSVPVLVGCLVFLSRHDTEYGHQFLIAAMTLALIVSFLSRLALRSSQGSWVARLRTRKRVFAATGGVRGHAYEYVSVPPRTVEARRNLRKIGMVAGLSVVWIVPIAAMIVPAVSNGPLAQTLTSRCRFGEWADDDVERLALWCRDHTPNDARFVGPPGPKTFRLWSRREVAFNRAASPYHAAGLADWAERFREHVGFEGSIASFAAAYLADRQALERGFDRMNAEDLVSLATRQGAGYLLASSKADPGRSLERVRVEGRYAIYRVIPISSQVSAKIVSSKARM